MVIVITVFCGCQSEKEKIAEGVQGNWYTTLFGKATVRFNYDDGEWATYINMDGKESKMSWGTYVIKGRKIYEEVEDVADVDGVKPAEDSPPKTIVYKDGEVKEIRTTAFTLTREKPSE